MQCILTYHDWSSLSAPNPPLVYYVIAKEVHVYWLGLEEVQTGSFWSLIRSNRGLQPFISFGLMHHCVQAKLHCSVAKLQDKFLMKINDLTIFFCIFVIHFWIGTFLLLTYIPRVKDTESLLLTYNLLTKELQKLLYFKKTV